MPNTPPRKREMAHKETERNNRVCEQDVKQGVKLNKPRKNLTVDTKVSGSRDFLKVETWDLNGPI